MACSIERLVALVVSKKKGLVIVPAMGAADGCRVDTEKEYWKHESSGRIRIGEGRIIEDWEDYENLVIGVYDKDNLTHLNNMLQDYDRLKSKLDHKTK
jgi:hypothetical protein